MFLVAPRVGQITSALARYSPKEMKIEQMTRKERGYLKDAWEGSRIDHEKSILHTSTFESI
jgi:hypothetical protein